MVISDKKIIFALDVDDLKMAKTYAKKLIQCPEIRNSVFAIKIGLPVIINNGLSIIKIIKRITDLPIICDLKLSERPDISGDIAKRAVAAGADYIVVQGFVGKLVIDGIKAITDAARIIVVTEMTHNNGGFTHRCANEIAVLAKQEQVFGIIGPGNRLDRLKEISSIAGDRVKVIAAGVTKQQEDGDEELQAMMAGANYIIQGDSIRRQLDRIKNNTYLNIIIEIVIVIVFIFIAYFLLDAFKPSPTYNALVSSSLGAFIGICINYFRKRPN
ncbi:MAG: orotidine-5'-phosphate decarboxylase [Candidatus Magnetominusculus sp. LBB02]|nr:orotidine-5'-phosphate decarboxylase [Candidatus Magnetominusculus sp. LBB02]